MCFCQVNVVKKILDADVIACMEGLNGYATVNASCIQ